MFVKMFVCLAMLFVTLLIHYLISRSKKEINFWKGTNVIFIICILGLITRDPAYYSAIVGYIVGSDISKALGWI